MRIVGGTLRGRSLAGPRPGTLGIRPTSDRMRESLFNILAHRPGIAFEGARVLDLFAGTGALSFEAISRGAAFALLVDDGTEARGLIRANQEALGLGGSTRVYRRDATRLGAISGMEPFDLAFCDPPYRKGLGELALASAREGGWLRPGALVLWEEAADATPTLPAGFSMTEERAYGESCVRFLSPV
ncbi:MAG: 16S rRNA (guanine(966)-N(2))-methyltransferase RsmD [Bosea sp.]|nr:16S rRNA (guanine(966)-N(2))-methyltransferase RsmD [Bosea sp. (in: a-proteobacteria)]